MNQSVSEVILTVEERTELDARARSMKLRARRVSRATLIVLLPRERSYREIVADLGITTATLAKWKKRFLANRVEGLRSQDKGSKATVLTPKVEAGILDGTRRRPPTGITLWSTQTLAKVLGVRYLTVARTCKRAAFSRVGWSATSARTVRPSSRRRRAAIGLYPPLRSRRPWRHPVYILAEPAGVAR
jgi:transposase